MHRDTNPIKKIAGSDTIEINSPVLVPSEND